METLVKARSGPSRGQFTPKPVPKLSPRLSQRLRPGVRLGGSPSLRPRLRPRLEPDLSSNLGGAHPICPEGNSSCPQPKLWNFSDLISDITGERPGRATSVSGPDVVATYNQEQKVELTSLEFASKTILSWKIHTRLIGCSVLTPISGSVNLPFDYFLHSNTKVAVVRRFWQ